MGRHGGQGFFHVSFSFGGIVVQRIADLRTAVYIKQQVRIVDIRPVANKGVLRAYPKAALPADPQAI